jgi:hypothetical protein
MQRIAGVASAFVFHTVIFLAHDRGWWSVCSLTGTKGITIDLVTCPKAHQRFSAIDVCSEQLKVSSRGFDDVGIRSAPTPHSVVSGSGTLAVLSTRERLSTHDHHYSARGQKR